jgi:hypothetical protein
MKDGTLVTYGAHGTVVYKAYKTDDNSWRYRYTLVPVKGGRKRYRVTQLQMRAYVAPEVEQIRTSAGLIQRPKTFRTRYPEYSGCTRRSYVGRDWVFKVAKYAGNNLKNAVEAARYAMQTGTPEEDAITRFGLDAVRGAKRYESVPIAECYLLSDGVLMMERVRPVYNLNAQEGADQLTRAELDKLGYRPPDWVGMVDCEQVGYTTKGELVAYDL